MRSPDDATTARAARATRRTPRLPYLPLPTAAALALALGAFAAALVAGAAACGALATLAPALRLGPVADPNGVPWQVALVAGYAAATAVLWRELPALALTSRRALGMRPGRPRAIDLATIGAATVAILAVHLALGLALLAIHASAHVQVGFERFAPAGAAEVAAALAVTAIAAPVAEELVFRAVIFNALAVRLPVGAAAVVSGVVFALAHRDLVLFPALAALGTILALVYRRTRSLWAAITVHALNNAVLYAIAVTTR